MATADGHVTVGDVRLAYREHTPAGKPDPVPVVALHGLASGAATWDRFAAELAGHDRRTIALDARGHGGSTRHADYGFTGIFTAMRDDVVAVLDRLGLWKVDLVGHSMGGHVASLVAMHAPHRVRRLLLEDTPPPPPDDAAVPAVGGPGLFRFGTAMLLTRFRQFDIAVAVPVLRELRTPDPLWWERLPALRTPTLIVRGGPRSHVPGEQLARVAELLPNCRMVTVESAGHRVHSTRPTEFSSAATTFITAPGPRD